MIEGKDFDNWPQFGGFGGKDFDKMTLIVNMKTWIILPPVMTGRPVLMLKQT